MLYIKGVPRELLPTYGGSVELADYCPYNQEFEWRESSTSGKQSVSTGAKTTGDNVAHDGTLTTMDTGALLHCGNGFFSQGFNATGPYDVSLVHRRDSRCELESNVPVGIDNAALEAYGEGSMCFEHGHKWVQRRCGVKRQFRFYGAGCYQVTQSL